MQSEHSGLALGLALLAGVSTAVGDEGAELRKAQELICKKAESVNSASARLTIKSEASFGASTRACS